MDGGDLLAGVASVAVGFGVGLDLFVLGEEGVVGDGVQAREGLFLVVSRLFLVVYRLFLVLSLLELFSHGLVIFDEPGHQIAVLSSVLFFLQPLVLLFQP